MIHVLKVVLSCLIVEFSASSHVLPVRIIPKLILLVFMALYMKLRVNEMLY